jgi:hypothetical protein
MVLFGELLFAHTELFLNTDFGQDCHHSNTGYL